MTAARDKLIIDVIEYSFGQFVVKEGEIGDRAFIIQSGEFEVLKSDEKGRDVPIARLGPKEIFGEMCLFEDVYIRSASVRVVSTSAVAMEISKKSFQAQVDELPDGVRSIIRIMMQRLQQANQQIVFLS